MILCNLIDTLEQVMPLDVVGTADDEEGAVRWLTETRCDCDLMIVDIFLRKGVGLNVLVRAQHVAPERPKVILTNYATDDIRHRCLALGADRVFDKSSELEGLITYCAGLIAPPAPPAASSPSTSSASLTGSGRS